MNLIKPCCCAAMVAASSALCHAEINAKSVDKLIGKGEYAIAAEVLTDDINPEMNRADIDGMILLIEKLAAKLRGGDASLSVKEFVPPDPDRAFEEVKKTQSTKMKAGIWMSGFIVSWKNDAQRVVVANRYLNTTTLLPADEAQKELDRYDAVKRVVDELNRVVVLRIKSADEDMDHYIGVKKRLSSIKRRLKTNRTRYLSYEVVSPYLYEAHCHLFVGISDDWRKSSVNTAHPALVEDCKTKGVKLLAKACHKEWLYSCSQDVRDQFLEIQRFMKENVAEREYEEYKVIMTLTDCNDPSKVRGADCWWK